VRLAKHDRDRSVKLPAPLVRELREQASRANAAWEEARKADDFSIWQPELERMLALKVRQAEALADGGDLYDALLDAFEPGMTVEQLDPLLEGLRADLVPFVQKVLGAPKPDTSFLKGPYDKARQEQVQRARAVILCANGAETPRLLLMSSSSSFPDGLANSSGLVGKHLMFNSYSSTTATFAEPLNEWKSTGCSHIVLDFHENDPKRGFYGGGGMDARLDWTGPISFALFHADPGKPAWGAAFKKRLAETFSRRLSIFAHATSLPVDTNCITLDPELKDDWGLPAIRFRYRDHPDDLSTDRWLQDRAYEILQAAGAVDVYREPVAEQSWANHMLGTCRMGNDPKASVVDATHRTHDVRNLFICDGSSMVTSTRGQPTATIQALAFRAAEKIGEFAKRGDI